MSADLLEDVKDENGTSVFLEMNSCDYIFLSIMEDDKHTPDEKYAVLTIAPDNNGLDIAKKISNALLAWREHVITTNFLVK